MDEATDKMNMSTWDEDARTPDTAIASSDEDTEQLRAEIEDTRAEMSQTINEIQERLSPENVMDQVKEKVREATIGKVGRAMERVGETIGEVTEPAREVVSRAGTAIKETGRSAGDVIWRNPIPMAMIGLGVGMLVMRAYRGGNGYDYDDTSRRSLRPRQQNLTGNQRQYGVGESERATTSTYSSVKNTATDLAHRSTETLSELGTKARDGASAIGNRFGEVLRENPLAVGAVAVAAGTAVGLILPSTRLENEYIGETSERLVDKAQEVAREAIDKVQSAAQQQMGSESQPGT